MNRYPHAHRAAAVLCLALLAMLSHAQPPAAVTDGTAFAKSIAPTSGAQLVNPAGVNPAAWCGKTTTPTAPPSAMGQFSAPNVSTTPLASAKSVGLAGYGNQAVLNCANFDFATGDPMQSQTCAAVNFMTNKCLSPSTQQAAILTANGTSQAVSGDCTGTYGAAQANYGYAEAMSSTDVVFGVVNGLPSAGPAVAGSSCSVQSVIVTPAQYALVNCTKDNTSSTYACTQTMGAKVVITNSISSPPPTCDAGAPIKTGTPIAGYTGQYCEYNKSVSFVQGLDLHCGSYFRFPDMTFIGETKVQFCADNSCTTKFYCYFQPKNSSCPAGYEQLGAFCVQRAVQRNFSDNCGPFTASTGVPLPQP